MKKIEDSKTNTISKLTPLFQDRITKKNRYIYHTITTIMIIKLKQSENLTCIEIASIQECQ